MNNTTLTDKLKHFALDEGIDLIGITSTKPFIVQRKKIPFIDPKERLSDAKALIVTGFYIHENDNTLSNESNKARGRYNSYDVRAFIPMEKYHFKTIKKFLENEGYKVKFNKNHIIPDKQAAVRAGIGKYGKNSVVITEKFGSYIMFVTMVTNAPLDYKEFPINKTECNNCDICIKSCPTEAIYAPFKVNRDLCITAWLWGDHVPVHLREMQENRLFGCGECVKACPKNNKLKPRENYPTEIEPVSDKPELVPLLTADKKYFKKHIAAFPLCAGEDAILGNAIIALTNIGKTSITDKLAQTLRHKKAQIRAYSAWALSKTSEERATNILNEVLRLEKKEEVINEIKHALNNLRNQVTHCNSNY